MGAEVQDMQDMSDQMAVHHRVTGLDVATNDRIVRLDVATNERLTRLIDGLSDHVTRQMAITDARIDRLWNALLWAAAGGVVAFAIGLFLGRL